MEPEDRPGITGVVQEIREISSLVLQIPDADKVWAEMMSHLPKESGVKWTNQTQTSRNLVYEITEAMGGMGIGRTVTGGTQLHGQGKSNLCGMFGINSGLRHALAELTGNRTGREVKDGDGYKVVEGGRTAQEIFKDNSTWVNKYGYLDGFNVCSFQSMLCSLISQVVPRSLEGLDGDPFLQSMIGQQVTNLEKNVQRLTGKTIFETEGWKRIPGCLYFMISFGLNPEHFELVAEKVIHPNIRGFNRFVAEVENDPNCEAPDLNKQMIDTPLPTYIVS